MMFVSPSPINEEFLLAALDSPAMFIPTGPKPVSAGFPSPAEDYAQKRLDIKEYLVRNPISTFFFTVKGDSMQEADIFEGDVLVVDRSIKPVHGHLVVAFVNGERLVKRLSIRVGSVMLLAGHPKYPPLTLKERNDLEVWVVVIGKFKRIPA